jgi:RecA-family ATPase
MEREIKPSRVYDLMTRELEKTPAWIGENLLPKGGILLFGGLEKIGKSIIGLELSRAMTTQTPLFGYPEFYVNERARVLLVDMEVGEHGLQDRTRLVFGKENPEVFGDFFWYVSKEAELQLDSKEGLEALTSVIDLVQPNILILDPIGNLHGWNEDKNTEIEQLFRVLQSLISAYRHNDMSVVVAHHFGKSATYKDAKIEVDPLERRHFRGAGKWLAGPDTLVTVHRSRELTKDSWELKTRTITRHGSPPPEMTLVVNRNNDLRVKFEHEKGMIAPLAKPGPKPLSELVKTKLVKPVQVDMGFEGV